MSNIHYGLPELLSIEFVILELTRFLYRYSMIINESSICTIPMKLKFQRFSIGQPIKSCLYNEVFLQY